MIKHGAVRIADPLKTSKAMLCTKVDLRFFAPASPLGVRQGYDVNYAQ